MWLGLTLILNLLLLINANPCIDAVFKSSDLYNFITSTKAQLCDKEPTSALSLTDFIAYLKEKEAQYEKYRHTYSLEKIAKKICKINNEVAHFSIITQLPSKNEEITSKKVYRYEYIDKFKSFLREKQVEIETVTLSLPSVKAGKEKVLRESEQIRNAYENNLQEAEQQSDNVKTILDRVFEKRYNDVCDLLPEVDCVRVFTSLTDYVKSTYHNVWLENLKKVLYIFPWHECILDESKCEFNLEVAKRRSLRNLSTNTILACLFEFPLQPLHYTLGNNGDAEAADRDYGNEGIEKAVREILISDKDFLFNIQLSSSSSASSTGLEISKDELHIEESLLHQDLKKVTVSGVLHEMGVLYDQCHAVLSNFLQLKSIIFYLKSNIEKMKYLLDNSLESLPQEGSLTVYKKKKVDTSLLDRFLECANPSSASYSSIFKPLQCVKILKRETFQADLYPLYETEQRRQQLISAYYLRQIFSNLPSLLNNLISQLTDLTNYKKESYCTGDNNFIEKYFSVLEASTQDKKTYVEAIQYQLFTNEKPSQWNKAFGSMLCNANAFVRQGVMTLKDLLGDVDILSKQKMKQHVLEFEEKYSRMMLWRRYLLHHLAGYRLVYNSHLVHDKRYASFTSYSLKRIQEENELKKGGKSEGESYKRVSVASESKVVASSIRQTLEESIEEIQSPENGSLGAVREMWRKFKTGVLEKEVCSTKYQGMDFSIQTVLDTITDMSKSIREYEIKLREEQNLGLREVIRGAQKSFAENVKKKVFLPHLEHIRCLGESDLNDLEEQLKKTTESIEKEREECRISDGNSRTYSTGKHFVYAAMTGAKCGEALEVTEQLRKIKEEMKRVEETGEWEETDSLLVFPVRAEGLKWGDADAKNYDKAILLSQLHHVKEVYDSAING